MSSYRLEDDPRYQDVLFLEAHWDELLGQRGRRISGGQARP